ncbi:MAG: F0F1 ATP synthase subunit B [Marinifilaceae bacterium]|jgi:F-type H+-transporting ATPase subunit b|nr:F0F1 ATP synthase subunit B [Marinifilaceae bacterium]
MGLISPEIGLLFWACLGFLIVLFILKKFAWKPILDSINERNESIDKALKAAEMAKEEVANIKSDNEKILDKARQEKDLILKEAKDLSSKIISEAKKKASEEADKIIADARKSIETEKNSAIQEMRNQLASLSIDIAEKLLVKEFEKTSKQEEYVKSLVDEIKIN